MKTLVLTLVLVLFFSCAPWERPYVDFDTAISEITVDYGSPAFIRDTVWYPDGSVRNRVAYWEIDEFDEFAFYNIYGVAYYYTSISAEIWNQNDPTNWNQTRYGWEILTWKKSRTTFYY